MPRRLLNHRPFAISLASLLFSGKTPVHTVSSRATRDLIARSVACEQRRGASPRLGMTGGARLVLETRRVARRVLVPGVVGLAFVAAVMPGSTLAHVEIDVGDGQYVMEVGFRDEPAYLGQPNALALSVEQYATGGTEPVDDLAATLSAEVSKDGQVMNLSLVPVGDGEYEAAFVPTAPGDYTFRISGTIGEAPVDESVTSGPTTFNSVEPLSAISFPQPLPDPAQLQTAVAEANAAASTARTLAIVGIVAGALGLILGAVAVARSRPPKTEPAPRASEPSGKLIR
jgi:hypothetical protein